MPQFSPKSVERIRKSVRHTEAQARDLTADPRQGQHLEPSFWAQLTGMDINGHVYTWIKARPDGHGGFIPDPRSRGGNAFEVNGRVGIMPGTTVRLFLMGQSSESGDPQYVFMAPPPGPEWPTVPIHDHRDNAHGGFAFACFAPGTSLPQQNWAL